MKTLCQYISSPSVISGSAFPLLFILVLVVGSYWNNKDHSILLECKGNKSACCLPPNNTVFQIIQGFWKGSTLWEGHERFNTREKLDLKILKFRLLDVSRRSQVAHFKSFSQEQIILKQHSEEEIYGKDYRAVLTYTGHCRCSWVFYRPTCRFRESHCMPCLSFPIWKVWLVILTSFLKVLLKLCMMSSS